MSSHGKPYRITLPELIRDTDTSESARRALERYRQLEAAGVQPAITFHRGGYSVTDPDAAILAENRIRHGMPLP